jgi:hypothetical protein
MTQERPKVTQDPTQPGPPLPDAKGLRRRYGLTLAQYLELLEAQGGVCAICGKPPTQRTGALVVDHDHDPPYPIDGLVHSNPCNRRLLQQVRHYLADPPGRRFGWTVPAWREGRTIARREAQRNAARRSREAKKAEKERERQDRYGIGSRIAAQLSQPAQDPAPVSQLDRLRAMTEGLPPDPPPVDFEDSIDFEPSPPPPDPPPPPEPAKRRSRFRFRLGGSETSGG